MAKIPLHFGVGTCSGATALAVALLALGFRRAKTNRDRDLGRVFDRPKSRTIVTRVPKAKGRRDYGVAAQGSGCESPTSGAEFPLRDGLFSVWRGVCPKFARPRAATICAGLRAGRRLIPPRLFLRSAARRWVLPHPRLAGYLLADESGEPHQLRHSPERVLLFRA